MHHRKIEDNYRLKKLAYETPGYLAGAYFDEDKNRYIKYSCNNKASRQTYNKINRLVLKKMECQPHPSFHKKIRNYKWDIL